MVSHVVLLLISEYLLDKPKELLVFMRDQTFEILVFTNGRLNTLSEAFIFK
jgi:hypothetical protein